MIRKDCEREVAHYISLAMKELDDIMLFSDDELTEMKNKLWKKIDKMDVDELKGLAECENVDYYIELLTNEFEAKV